MKIYIFSNTINIANESDDVKISVARDHNTSARILTKLAHDGNPTVRESVACNPNTPKEILELLLGDPDRFVQDAIAENPGAPSEILHKMFEDNFKSPTSPDVHYTQIFLGLSRNPNIPIDDLCKILDSEDFRFRWLHEYALGNPSLPADYLTRIQKGCSRYAQDINFRLAENPATPPSTLDELAEWGSSGDSLKDEYKYEFYQAIAENPNASPELVATMQKLIAEFDEYYGEEL